MSNSLVSGPYASAVSIKSTPSSVARLRTLSTFTESAVNARRWFLSLMHYNSKCLFEISAERDNASFVPGHGKNLSAVQIGHSEQPHYFVRHFRCAVLNGLRRCRSLI